MRNESRELGYIEGLVRKQKLRRCRRGRQRAAPGRTLRRICNLGLIDPAAEANLLDLIRHHPRPRGGTATKPPHADSHFHHL